MALTFAISFLAAIYGPLELYFTNMDEFHFDFFALFPELIKLFLLLMAAGLTAFFFSFVLYKKFYDAVLAAAGIGYFCTYIQGMFFSGSLPPLDGERILWDSYRLENLTSILIWLLVGVAVVLLIRFFHMKKMYKVFTVCALFLTAVLLSTVLVVGIQNDGLVRKSGTAVTTDKEFQMSDQQNFVIFVLDAVDSKTFDTLMETEEPGFRDVLEDFTYYPNTVGTYIFTKHAIPYMLHGQWYENQEDFRTFTTMINLER